MSQTRYAFMPCFTDKDKVDAVLITSDQERKKYLYELSLKKIIKILSAIGSNYPHSSHSVYCEKIKDFKVVNK